MISRREIFKMLGLAGLSGLFARDLEAIVPRPVSDVPPEFGYAVKEIPLDDGYVLVQIAVSPRKVDEYLRNFNEKRDTFRALGEDWEKPPEGMLVEAAKSGDAEWWEEELRKDEEKRYRELIKYYGSAEHKEKQRQWREAMERLEKEFPTPKRS
jgi:hypothetical protein